MALTDMSQISTLDTLQINGVSHIVGSNTITVDRLSEAGNVLEAHGTTVPTASTAGYSKNAMFRKTNAVDGTSGLYTNIGTTTSCNFSIVESATPGDSATVLVDSNGITAVDVGTTASAVNNLRVTDSAAGAVSANAVVLSAVGTDSAISLSIVGKGATAILTFGEATQTGAINLGIATTAATSTVNISSANGTASTQTINIGAGTSTTSGGKVVNIASGIPGASTTNTVAIGNGGTTTGTVGVTLGSIGNAAHTTAIQGGSGATAITLFPQTTGVVTVGAAAGTGDVVLGSSSATQIVKIGNGAGVSTVNIANVSVAGANVNMAVVATGAGVTDTIAIATGNAAATGIKVVNIATGTPGTDGNNRVTIGGGATSRVSIKALATQSRISNYIATEGGANNAITGSLVDASGTAVPLAAGLEVVVKLAHSLQAGANTFDFNAGGAVAINSSRNVANNLGTAYAATGVVKLLYTGSQWVDMSQ